MVYATSLTLPAQIAAGNKLPVDEILWNLSTAALIPTRQGQKEAPTEPPAALASGDLVYVRKGGQLQPLAQPYSGPYKVLERGPKYFRLGIGGKDTVVTVDCLKPHTGTAETTPAAPPRRGRRPESGQPHQDTSDANDSIHSGPGTITRPSSHYRSSPCAPAQGSQQIRPLSWTKRSRGSDVGTVCGGAT